MRPHMVAASAHHMLRRHTFFSLAYHRRPAADQNTSHSNSRHKT